MQELLTFDGYEKEIVNNGNRIDSEIQMFQNKLRS